MNFEDIKDRIVAVKKLSYNSDYYSNVFKKTERLVSVTFYILSFIPRTPQAQVHIDAITTRSLHLYETALASLSFTEAEAPERLFTLGQSLLALEGTLRIAHGARLINDELLTVLLEPFDLITRYLRNHYLEKLFTTSSPIVVGAVAEAPERPVRSTGTRTYTRSSNRVVIPKGDISSDAHLVYSQLTDRAERIKTVLDAKPEATIKDIAEVITDVSEKTIQRELNSLIEKGQVIRQGERRWSRYSIAK